jgi:hypothetical protein
MRTHARTHGPALADAADSGEHGDAPRVNMKT